MIRFITIFLTLTCLASAQNLEWETKSFSHKAELGEKEVSFSFKAKNTGSKNIVISEGKSSCACMIIDEKFPLTVKPGEAVEIHANYDFTGKLGLNKGTIFLTIGSNKQELKVEIDIPVPVTVNPRFIIWKKNDQTEKEVKITVHKDYKGSIDKAFSKDQSAGITTSLNKTDDGYTLKISPPSAGLSKKRTWVTVEGKDGQGKSQEYRIYLIFN